MRRLVLVLVAALVAAGCSSSDGVTASTAEEGEATAVVDATAEPTPEPTAVPVEPTATALPAATPAPTATVEPTPEPTPEPTETPTGSGLELAGDGPYGVGVATIMIASDTDRPLTVDVWFPVDDGTTGVPARYAFLTGDYYDSPRAISADVADIATDGPFPLVVYSHGSGGIRFVHSDYTEVLASHGYVVAAADHTGNTAVEQFLNIEDEFADIALNRPRDVAAVIDALTDPANETAAPYATIIDADQIAVTGHSFGGFTSYAIVSGYENENGSVPADDRVDAIITLAPAVGPAEEPTLLSDDALARVDVPALVMVGTDDKTTPIVPNVERAWDLTTSSPHYRLELVAAEHQSFTDTCNYLAAFEAGQAVTDPVREIVETFGEAGCAEGDMSIERVQALTNTFAVRFLASVFDGDPMVEPTDVAAVDDVIYDVKPAG